MFGYVKIWKPELKMCEYDRYQGVYCSLCRTLGKRYGLAARMTLSYDVTFLALFRMALEADGVAFSKGHCSFRPTKKCLRCGGDNGAAALDYAADVAMLLVYHKLLDSMSDERLFGRIKARLGKLFMTKSYRKAAALRPDEAKAVQAYTDRQQALEREHTASVDAAAEPTALLLSALASGQLPPDVPIEPAARFGYCLGRFIYLADAADDLEQDLKTGNYNPYVLVRGLQKGADAQTLAEARVYAAQSLHACAAACAESYEQLPVKRFDGILRNVLFFGLPSVIARLQSPDTAKCKKINRI